MNSLSHLILLLGLQPAQSSGAKNAKPCCLLILFLSFQLIVLTIRRTSKFEAFYSGIINVSFHGFIWPLYQSFEKAKVISSSSFNVQKDDYSCLNLSVCRY